MPALANERALQKDENGKYRSEGDVHDIIIPRRRDSEELNYEDHNLPAAPGQSCLVKVVVPLEGLEPTTPSLRMMCSTS